MTRRSSLAGALTRRIVPALVAVLAASALPASAQTVVSTCGQEVHGFAILNADLDCTGFAGNAVIIHGGKLNMNGKTLTGGQNGVYCDGNCKIFGPGTITGSTYIGIIAFQTVVRMTGVNVTNNGVIGIECFKACNLNGPSNISGNDTGIRAATLVKIRAMTLSGNDVGIDASNTDRRGRALVYDTSVVTGNRIGVSADIFVKSVNSSITANTEIGIRAGITGCPRKGLATIKSGTVTGNGTDAGCGTTVACADLATCTTAPHIAGGATCDHSYVIDSGIPGSNWDVCASD